MTSRPFLFDVLYRNNFICRSCRLSLRNPPPRPWPIRLHSSAAAGVPRRSADGKQARAAQSGSGDNFTVRFFDQDDVGRIRPRSDATQQAEVDEVDQQLEELESKFKEAMTLMKAIRSSGAKKEVNAMKRRFRLDAAFDYPFVETELPKIEQPFDTTPVQRHHINNLNAKLKDSFRNIQKELRVNSHTPTNLWRYYSAARRTLALDWTRVPREVWDFLWQIFALEKRNPNRMAHLYVLTKDMNAAGVPLGDSQQLLSIEAMFIEGSRKAAIENWVRCMPTLGSKDETYRDFWEVGVRMCSLEGDLERAGRAAEKLLETPDQDPRILVPLITAAAKDESKVETAWSQYRRLRDLLGPSMTIEDYDEVISCFLMANQTEHAFHAFVDMMFSGSVVIEEKDRLPSSVRNPFFIGKWLKRLIGAGDLDGALKVLQFLQERRIMTSPIQVNGLIGAWIRTGTEESLTKAEELAWAMVHSRLQFVDLRRRHAVLDWPIKLFQSQRESTLGLQFVPRASLETFSLLAENYRVRGLHDRLVDLWTSFKRAEIGLDGFMMTQLMASYIEHGQTHKAHELYHTFVHEHNITPNGETFSVLFRSLQINSHSRGRAQTEEERTMCRELFRELASYAWVLQREDGFNDQLARVILHSFRRLEDYVGFLVALRSVRTLFNYALPDSLVLELAVESTKLHTNSKEMKQKAFTASENIEWFLERKGRTIPNGATDEELAAIKAEDYDSYLVYYYKSKAQIPDHELQQAFVEVAEEMGVADIVL